MAQEALTERLTEQQRQMVEQHHNMIYWYLNLKKMDAEEWYGELSVALCRAALNWDEGRGQFSTLAYKVFEDQVWRVLHRDHALKRGGGAHDVPLEPIIQREDHEFACEKYLTMHDEGLERVEWRLFYEQFFRELKQRGGERIQPRDLDAFTLYTKGVTLKEIGEKYGVSRQAIEQRIRKVKPYARKIMEECY